MTLAYGLTDSPTGQLARISDARMGFGRFAPPEPPDRDAMLTNVSIYWFTKTAGSSAPWYFEDATTGAGDSDAPNSTPTGAALLPYNFQSVRKIAERSNNIVHWTTFDRGGHFAALDAPDLLHRRSPGILRPLPLTVRALGAESLARQGPCASSPLAGLKHHLCQLPRRIY